MAWNQPKLQQSFCRERTRKPLWTVKPREVSCIQQGAEEDRVRFQNDKPEASPSPDSKIGTPLHLLTEENEDTSEKALKKCFPEILHERKVFINHILLPPRILRFPTRVTTVDILSSSCHGHRRGGRCLK